MHMKFRAILLSSAFLGLMAVHTPAVLADTVNAAASDTTNVGLQSVDAGKLIGENVVDANGDKVGEIDSVIVDTKGKVTAVVIDVSGWLESKKDIAVKWTDLKTNADGKITSSLTKDMANKASSYDYSNQSLRGKVLTENGAVYKNDGTTQTNASNSTSTDNGTTMGMGTPIRNADGSLNASQIVGLKVTNDQNESVGKIGELLLDKGGKVAGVIVDVGGFLGIGTHPVMLKWNEIALVDRDGSTVANVNISKDNLKQMPLYKTSMN
jgi:sporulation protein YlmC with PRC-barrel domain